jgi:hypothetical protein
MTPPDTGTGAPKVTTKPFEDKSGKCILGNKEVSYLGFTLMPEGIQPGKNKLKAIVTAKAPADVKTINTRLLRFSAVNFNREKSR